MAGSWMTMTGRTATGDVYKRQVMHPDGVCQLPGGLYTKTVEYEDINYSVASTEDQTAIFSGWSSFLNYFDSSLPFQLSFINRRSRSRRKYKVNIPPAQDDFDLSLIHIFIMVSVSLSH